MQKAVEELDRARQRPLIRSQPVPRGFEGADVKVAPVWALVTARGVPAGSKEEQRPSLTVDSRDPPNLEVGMGLNMMVILKEQQQQNWAFERYLKAAEVVQERENVLLNVGDTSVVGLDDDYDSDLGLHVVERKRFLQGTPDFETSYKAADAAAKEAAADPDGQGAGKCPTPVTYVLLRRVVSPMSCVILCSHCRKRILHCTLYVL